MKTVLYINNDRIQIISVSFKKDETFLENKISIDIDAGSIVNGVIINKEPIIEKLVAYKSLLKNSTVLINSSNVFIKKLEFPSLSKKQLLSVMKSEFSLVEGENILYDSNVFSKGGLNTALCCAMPIKLAESYIELFNEAKISPKKIDITQNAIAKFIKTKAELQEKTFILNIVDGSNLETILFEKGEHALSNRSRIISEKESSEYTQQLHSKLSSIIQFNKSEKSENEIEASYYIGLNSSELADLQDYSLKIIDNIEIKSFDEMIKIDGYSSDFFYAFMGIFDKKNDINILDNYKKRLVQNKIEKDKKTTKILTTILLVLLIVFGSYGYFKTTNYLLGLENARISTFLNEKIAKKTLDDVLYKNLRIREIPITTNEIAKALIKANKANGFDSSKLIRILSEAEKSVTIKNLIFDAQTKTISIKGQGSNEYSSSIFVANLKSTNLFQNVEYAGYSTLIENVYVFDVVCTLK